MDKIFSARIDEAVLQKIQTLAQKLKTSKKNILESAITMYDKKIGESQKVDIIDEAFGCWRRKESAEETIKANRRIMRNSVKRHRK